MITEDRIVDIELKLTSQEYLVETLNKMVYQQQRKIDEMEGLCAALVRRVRDLTEANEQNPLNERPPHY